MKQLHLVLKAVNKIVTAGTAILVALVLLFSGYMLWDNQQIFKEAENAMLDIQELKPVEDEDGKLSFDELLKINPDVKLWITLDGTVIDGPVVQGRDNYYYLNHDVFCKTSMAGSLYLDCRNAGDLTDIYNIIYGHHMKGSLMFGDLDLYLDKEFFAENTTGTILLPDGKKNFRTLAVLQLLDSTREIFRPTRYTDDLSELCDFVKENALHYSRERLDKIIADPDKYQVTALVTCTDGKTGTRLVLLIVTDYVKPHRPDDPDDDPSHGDQPDDPGSKPTEPLPQPQTGYNDYLVLWITLLLVSGLSFAITFICLKKQKARQSGGQK